MSRLFEPMASNTPPRSDGLPLPLSSTIGKKKRGGRQLRQVVLSPDLKFSIRQFAAEVGMPRLMEPTGFRDFRGWLERVAGPSASNAWGSLVQALLTESGNDAYKVMFMKEEVVREIVRAIVVPRPGESAKLVSTNCGRQCARPRSGNTLMTILERILVEKGIVSFEDLEHFMQERALPQGPLHRDSQPNLIGSASSSAFASDLSYTSSRGSMSLDALTTPGSTRLPQLWQHQQNLGQYNPSQDVIPPASRTHHDTSGISSSQGLNSQQLHFARGPERLPSFQELEDSLDERRD